MADAFQRKKEEVKNALDGGQGEHAFRSMQRSQSAHSEIEMEAGQGRGKREVRTPTKGIAGIADGIKISKTLVGYAREELQEVIKSQLKLEVKIYEKAMGKKPNGGLGGHMHAWYEAVEKYVLIFLRAWKGVRLHKWQEEGMDEGLKAAKAMGWERDKSKEVMRGYLGKTKEQLEGMHRMERSWKKETKVEERAIEKEKEKSQKAWVGSDK